MNLPLSEKPPETLQTCMVFTIEEMRFAIGIDQVERIERSALLSAMPDQNDSVYGLLNYHGEMVPVFHLRERFKLKKRPLSIDDRLVIISYKGKRIALAVDSVDHIMSGNNFNINVQQTTDIIHYKELGLDYHVMKSQNESVVYIFDLEMLLNAKDLSSIINK